MYVVHEWSLTQLFNRTFFSDEGLWDVYLSEFHGCHHKLCKGKTFQSTVLGRHPTFSQIRNPSFAFARMFFCNPHTSSWVTKTNNSLNCYGHTSWRSHEVLLLHECSFRMLSSYLMESPRNVLTLITACFTCVALHGDKSEGW